MQLEFQKVGSCLPRGHKASKVLIFSHLQSTYKEGTRQIDGFGCARNWFIDELRHPKMPKNVGQLKESVNYLDGWREKETRASMVSGSCFEKASPIFHQIETRINVQTVDFNRIRLVRFAKLRFPELQTANLIGYRRNSPSALDAPYMPSN
jgi:hypothetical protein